MRKNILHNYKNRPTVFRKTTVKFLLGYLLGIFSLLPVLAQQSDITISGVVVDNDSMPMPGVSVLLKGTSKGTSTDGEGKFTLSVPGNGVLVFSFIGYETVEEPVNGRNTLKILLKSSVTELNQVVVVGYGTQRKMDMTGATATVKGEELTKQPVLTATQAIQGKVAGIQIISSGQPGSSPVIRVRGTGTALAGTAALFVVDGVLTDDISNINTADIVSMDVLKDASATAIYGSRGANGVVIITTKRGDKGSMKVSFNTNGGIRSAANLVKMANAAEYANYVSTASGNLIVPGSVSTDWYGEILRDAYYQNSNLSLSGGSEKANYFLSLGYFTDEGIVIKNKYNRFTIRSNTDFIINDKLKTGVSVSYSNGKNQNVNLGTAYNNAYRAAPIIPGMQNGKYGNTSVFQNVGNAILDINNNDDLAIDNRLQGAGYLEYKPIQGLTLRSSLGGDWTVRNGRVYNYQFNNDTTTFLTSGGNQRNPNSNLSIEYRKTFRWVWDNTVTYSRKFGNHTITVLAGTTAEQYNMNYITAFRKDVPADKSLWYIGTGNANTSTNDGSGDKWARNSYLGRVNYNFSDKYLLTASFRADGSSRFPSKNRWGYFPSVGLGWVLSNEGFMDNLTMFQSLKLRASWGKVGNDRIPSDAYVVTVTPNLSYPFGGGVATPGGAITQIKDPNLKWEITEEFDLGLEFTMIQNRLTGEIGYYDKKSKDLLINVKVPSVTGDADGVVLTNAASIQNRGLEVALNWKGNITESLSYKIGGNLTLNQNKVVGLNGGQPILDGGIGGNQIYTTKTDNGQPVGSFYLLQVLGVFQNQNEVDGYKNAGGQVIQPSASPGDFKYQDTDGNGKIDDNDRVFVGSYQPKAYFGFNISLAYKGLDFSADLYGNVGNKVYNGKKAFRQNIYDNVEADMAYKRWTPSNGSQTEPAANGGFLPVSTYFLESGDFIRLNNITLGYTLPAPIVQKIKISNVRVFVTAQNFFTYKKYSGFTAELPGDPTKAGIELNAYPTNKTLAAGLNIGF